jgi:hypothetical protein
MRASSNSVRSAEEYQAQAEQPFQRLNHFSKSSITIVSEPPDLVSGESIMSFCLSDSHENEVRDVRSSNRIRRSHGYLITEEDQALEGKATDSSDEKNYQKASLVLLHIDSSSILEELQAIMQE